jgi:hypothetical protein
MVLSRGRVFTTNNNSNANKTSRVKTMPNILVDGLPHFHGFGS